MSTYWPRSNSFEFDDAGVRAPGAKVFFFDAGTSTPRVVYQDAALSTAHTHPVLADGNGRWPQVFLSYGSYHELATTSGGTELWETDNIPNPAPTDPGAGVAADSIFQTGDMIQVGKNGTRTGFVRCNGRTMGSAASGGTERANADTAALFAFIWDNYANAQAAVSGGRGASAAADFAANKTIALPDYRGSSLIGFDDMGGADAARIPAASIFSGSPLIAGSIMGSNTHTLQAGHLPVTTPAGSVSTVTGTITQSPITPTGTITQSPITPTGTINDTRTWGFVYGGTTSNATTGALLVITDPGGAGFSEAVTVTGGTVTFAGNSQTLTFAGNSQTLTFSGGTPTFTGTSFGSGIAHNNINRSILVTILMKL